MLFRHYVPPNSTINDKYKELYFSILCLFRDLKKGDQFLEFLKEPRIAELTLLWMTQNGSYLEGGLDDGTFSEMTELKTLTLSGCIKHHYTSTFFRDLRKLISLTLHIQWDECIRTIDSDWLQPLTGLRVLNLTHFYAVRFPDKSFCGLKQLKSLDISDNKLSSINGLTCSRNINDTLDTSCTTCLPNLTRLVLSNNPLSKLNVSFRDVPLISVLLINNSSLSDLHGIDSLLLTGLVEFDISNNNLSSFIVQDVEKCNDSRLSILRLKNNRLNYISPGLFSCTKNLTELIVSSNSLTLETLMEAGVNHLTRLKRLDLNGNIIPTLTEDLIGNMTGLTELSCRRCSMKSIEKDIFRNLRLLLRLDLSGNTLVEFDIPYAVPSMAELDLSGNSLSHIPNLGGVWSNLHNLDLSGNNITELNESIQFVGLVSLQNLTLASNIIDHISEYFFINLLELRSLDISNNNIVNFGSQAYFTQRKLRSLNLALNKIKTMPDVLWFGILTDLDLHGNQISELVYTKPFSISIKWLDLSSNQISHIDDGYLTSPQLKFVNLTFNRLHFLNQSAFWSIVGNKPHIYLEGNFLHCDCNNEFLRLTSTNM